MGSGGMSSRLSRGSVLSTATTTQSQQSQQPQFQIQQTPPQQAATTQQAQAANNTNFPATDTQDFHALTSGGRKYFQDQTFDVDGYVAIVNYLDNRPEPNPQPGDSSLHSISQNLNFNMAHNRPLSFNQQFMKDALQNNMHNLGQNLLLTRYDHSGFLDTILKKVGLGSYQNYTEAQLQKALIGTTYGEQKFISTSYNDFRHMTPADQATFKDRAVKITYRAKASTQALMPGNGPGGQQGEIILAPSNGRQNMKIVGVKLTNQKARAQGTRSYTAKRIELIVEVD